MDIEQIYRREVRRKFRKFTRQEEAELAAKAKAGDAEAKEKLLHSILPFVVRIAWRYRDRPVDLMDLIQAGNDGAMEAIEKLNPEKGRLTTVAYQWIRQRITNEIDTKGSTIRVTRGVLDGTYERKGMLNEKEIEAGKRIFFGTLSLNAPRPGNKNDHDGKELGDFIPERSRQVIDEIIDRERGEIESDMIDRLPPKLSRIVRMRLDGVMLDDIGEEFGVTGEAIRQRLVKAIAMLQEMRPIQPKERIS